MKWMHHPSSLPTSCTNTRHATANTLWCLKIAPLHPRLLCSVLLPWFWELGLPSLSTFCANAVWSSLLTVSEACRPSKGAFILSKGQKKKKNRHRERRSLLSESSHMAHETYHLPQHSTLPQNLVLPLNDNLTWNCDGILNIYWIILSIQTEA